jgi:hypothetical protein
MTPRPIYAGLATLMPLLGTPGPCLAGQYCGEPIEGGAVTRPTEEEARRDAQNWWVSRAGSVGKGFQDWATAQDKSISCEARGNGTVRCVAKAKPCLPEGALPSDIPKIEM